MPDIKNSSKDDKKTLTFDDLMFSQSNLLNRWNNVVKEYNKKCNLALNNANKIKGLGSKIKFFVEKMYLGAVVSKDKILNIESQLDETDKKLAELGYGYQSWRYDVEKSKYRILTANRTSEQIETQIKENGKQVQENIITEIKIALENVKKNDGLKFEDISNQNICIAASLNNSTNILMTLNTDRNGYIKSYQKGLVAGLDNEFTPIGIPINEATFYTSNRHSNINKNDYSDHASFLIAQIENAKENFSSVMNVSLEKNNEIVLMKGVFSVIYSPKGSEEACFEGDYCNKKIEEIGSSEFNHGNDIIGYSNHSHAFEFEKGKLKSQKDYLGNWTEINKKEF